MPFGWVAAGTAVLGAGTSLYNGIQGSNAAKSAAQTEANADNQASQTELGMFNQAQGDLQPWMSAGQNGLSALQKLLNVGPGTTGGATSPIMAMLGMGPNGATGGGINPSTFQGSPGYQDDLQQTMNGVTNSAAASGGLGGNALKALQSNASGLANNTWQQYLSSANGAYQGLVGNVAGLSTAGQQAAGAMAGQAMSVGNEIGGNQIGAGNALAAGTMGSANAMAGGINGAVGAVGNSLGGPLLYSLMNQAQSGGGGSGGGGGLGSGISNLLAGYNWGGTPGAGVMNALSGQANMNALNGAPGL